MSNRMSYIAARIPTELAERIDELSNYYKGGKSEIVRRALSTGLEIVVGDHVVNFPMTNKKQEQ